MNHDEGYGGLASMTASPKSIRKEPRAEENDHTPPDYEGFTKAVMEEWHEHWDLEASDRFELALKFNILREIPGGFDPECHVSDFDTEPGDPWYEKNY